MPVLKKTLFPENLEKYTTLIQDTDSNSKYFKITELPDTFTGGKNSFLIQGSDYLVPDTLIKIEIKDSQGNIIYHEPGEGIVSSSIAGQTYTKEYYEGNSKVVSVHIYPDTAYGDCTITILGELKEYDNNGVRTPIPVNWNGQYNVRWQKKVNVNPKLNNTTKVRFYRRPKIQITENILPIYVYNSGSLITATGIVSGSSIYGPVDTSLMRPGPGFQWTSKLTPSGSFRFTPDMSGSTIKILVEYPSESVPVGDRIIGQNWVPVPFDTGAIGFNLDGPLKITGVTSSMEAHINGIFHITNSLWPDSLPIISGSFERGQMTLAYSQSAGYVSSGVDSSFANIKLTDLETFTGDAVRLKIYGRSRNDLGDYTLLEDITLESDELLETPFFMGQLNVRTGVFSNPFLLSNFWKTENLQTGVSVGFDSSGSYAVLTPTVDANSTTGLFKFYTSQSIDFTKNTEYALDYTPILTSSVANYGRLDVYISGSAANTIGKPDNYGQLIHTIYANESYRKFNKQQINFKPENNGSGSLVFIPKSGKWKLADISLRAAQESAFSPNEFSINLGLPVKIQNEIFDFKFEIYDINNNYVPVLLEASQSFVGGNDLRIRKDLKVNVANTIFNYSRATGSYFPKEIIIDVEKTALTGSLQFFSTSVDVTGGVITGTPSPGLLTTLTPEKKYKVTIDDFTGSLSNVTVSAITYTASCEGIERYFTIYRVSDGADGPTGPGILMRGIWTSSLDYFGSDTQNSRRDAVIYPDPATNNGVTQFFVAKTKTGPTSVPGPQAPNGAPADNSYWQYLGNQQMFVAAKIGLFEESYVQNTLNVGTNNNGGVSSANITLHGGSTFPYLSIGQTTGQAYASGGIFIGNDSGSFRMSLVGAGGQFLWDGANLRISGSVSAIDGNIGGWIISQSALTNTNGRLKLNPITPGMEIYDTSNVKRLDVRFGAFTSLGSTSIPISPPLLTTTATTMGGSSANASGYVEQYTNAFPLPSAISNPGTYAGNLTLSAIANVAQTSANYNGTSYFYREIQILNSSDVVVASIGGQLLSINNPSTTYSFPAEARTVSIFFPTAGIYKIRSKITYDWTVYANPPVSFPWQTTWGTITVFSRQWNNTAFNATLENNLCELTDEGLQILSSTEKYVKLPRTNINKVFDLKGKAYFEGNNSSEPVAEFWSFNDPNADGVYIWARDQALYLANGTAWRNTQTTWNLISDRRLKKNEEEFSGSLNIIKQLKPKQFEFINPEDKGEHASGKQIGFIAQDVEQIWPAWVSSGKLQSGSADIECIDPDYYKENKSGSVRMQGVGFGNDFFAMLVGSIKELSAKVEYLEAKLSGSL